MATATMVCGSAAEDAPEMRASASTMHPDATRKDSLSSFLEAQLTGCASVSSTPLSVEREVRRWLERAERIHREHMERLQMLLLEEWASFLEQLQPEVYRRPVPPPPLQFHPESPPRDWLRPLQSPPPTPPSERSPPKDDSPRVGVDSAAKKNSRIESDQPDQFERGTALAMSSSPTPFESPRGDRSQSSTPRQQLSNEASPQEHFLMACQPGVALHQDLPDIPEKATMNLSDGEPLRDDSRPHSLPSHHEDEDALSLNESDAPNRNESFLSASSRVHSRISPSMRRAQTPVVVWKRRGTSHSHNDSQSDALDKRRRMKALGTRRFDDDHSNFWEKILYSKIFNIFSFLASMVNMVSIGLSADCKMKALVLASPPATYCRTHLPWVGELLCFLVLILDTAVRFLAERAEFWKGHDRLWNLFNVVLIMETGLYFAGDALPNLSFMRVFRVVTSMGLLDHPNISKFFRSMQMMVFIIWQCMPHWLWTMTTLIVFVYLFAVVLMWQIQLSLRSGSVSVGMATAFSNRQYDGSGDLCESWHDPELCTHLMSEGALLEGYGTFARTFLTLFKAISGGDDWGVLMQPLQEVVFFVPLVFLFYVSFMLFGVLNIVVGLFVDTAMQMSQKKRDLFVKDLADKEQGLRQELQKLFQLADSDGSGTVNSEEFGMLLNTPEVSAVLSSMELEIQEAQGLFKMMDIEGTDEVCIEDFITCALRVKGMAKSIDVCMLLYEHRQHSKAFVKNFEKLRDSLGSINEKLSYTIVQQKETRHSLAASFSQSASFSQGALLVPSPSGRPSPMSGGPSLRVGIGPARPGNRLS